MTHSSLQIRGKRCGIAASEDHDTLFLGNICNTWTKEAVSVFSFFDDLSCLEKNIHFSYSMADKTKAEGVWHSSC